MFDKIILHVGLHKTGTTSLQNYFGKNRKELKSLGVLYPEFSINDFTPNNHSWPIKNLTMNHPNQYHLNIMNNILKADLSMVIESLNEQFLKLGDSEESTLLISGEGISTLNAKELNKLKEKLLKVSKKEVVIEVHYFTRNVADYISSVIQQRLKGGTRESIILTGLSKISPFRSFLSHRLFKAIFTSSIIKEHSYEKACAYTGGLETYFADNILNINHDSFLCNSQRVNSGLSNISFQLIRYYINHSAEYVRIPTEKSSYKSNIKALSQIKGDKFMMTNEQKLKLMVLIEKKAHIADWKLFFEDKFLPSENICWLDFDIKEVKRHLCEVDIECQKLLIVFFENMLKTQKENINVSLVLEHLVNLGKSKPKLPKFKGRVIRVVKRLLGTFKC